MTPGNARWNGLVHAESENNMPTARAFARLPFGYCGRAGMSFANGAVAIPQRPFRGRAKPPRVLRRGMRGGAEWDGICVAEADFHDAFHPAHAPFVPPTASAQSRVRRSGIAGAYGRYATSGSDCVGGLVRAENGKDAPTALARSRVCRSSTAGARECCSRMERSPSRSGRFAGARSPRAYCGAGCEGARNGTESAWRKPIFTMRFISGGIPPSRR